MVEVKGMTGNDYNFVLSAAGKQMASERFQVSQYAGACPVSLQGLSGRRQDAIREGKRGPQIPCATLFRTWW